MNTVKLNVIVTPTSFKSAYEGYQYSDLSIINVNQINDVYVVLITDEEFKRANPVVTLTNIKEIFKNNLKDCEIIFTLMYDGNSGLDQKTLLGLLRIDSHLTSRPKSFYPMIYVASDQLVEVAQKVVATNEQTIEKDVPDYDEHEDDYNEEFDDEDLLRTFYGIDLGGKSKKKSKRSKPNFKKSKFSYSSSRVLKASKNPKRSYRRHGVIICKNKKAIRKDEEIIKDFLKDFIPGHSSFKKHLRKDLLRRWVAVYVVTKKHANKLQKKYKKSLNKVSKHQRNEQIVDLTRKMLTVPIDSWNDPNR